MNLPFTILAIGHYKQMISSTVISSTVISKTAISSPVISSTVISSTILSMPVHRHFERISHVVVNTNLNISYKFDAVESHPAGCTNVLSDTVDAITPVFCEMWHT